MVESMTSVVMITNYYNHCCSGIFYISHYMHCIFIFKWLLNVSYQLLCCYSRNILSYKTNQIIHWAIYMTIEIGDVTVAIAIALYTKSESVVVLKYKLCSFTFSSFISHHHFLFIPHFIYLHSIPLLFSLFTVSIIISTDFLYYYINRYILKQSVFS